MFNTSFLLNRLIYVGCSAKKRFSIARILQNRGQASANSLSVKSDIFCSNLILENIKKRFITLSSSRPVKHVSFDLVNTSLFDTINS